MKELREFLDAILARDGAAVSRMLASSPSLARARFETGASRQAEKPYFLAAVGRYIWLGDTALHISAAAYWKEGIDQLLAAGAGVRARNRLGEEPLHAAAAGLPGSPAWNPEAQAAVIVRLIEAGADPNAANKSGVAPLHRAVRTRCAAAVRALLEHGADPGLRNKNGSTPMLLAIHNTGRGGSGSPEAKAQRREILHLLRGQIG